MPNTNPNTVPPVTHAEDARRARRAMGAVFFVPFGAAWLALGESRILAAPKIAYAVIATVAVFLLWLTISVRKQALRKAGPLPAPTEDDRRTKKWFHAVNAGQWILIAVLGIVLLNVGLGAWVIPLAMFIIGAHFLALARLFFVASHYVTGTALMALACLYPFATAAGPASGVGPVLAGLILWASAGYALRPAGKRTVRRMST